MEPLFFKYIVPSSCTERLKIPPAHHWNKDKDYPDNVILTDKKGNVWLVKLEKVDDCVCFIDGWLDYVKENNVEAGDFVVFENVSPNVYSALLLDKITTCEKEDFNSEVVEEEEEEHSSAFEDSEDVTEEEEEEDVSEEEEEDVTEEEEEDEDDDDDDDFYRRGDRSRSRREKGHEEPPKRWTKSPSNRPADIYGNELFKSKGIPLPENPYFLTYKRPNRTDELYVPLNVIKDYNLNLPKITIMRDSKKGEWVTELNVWKDGRCWYCGGWADFCMENYVQEGDPCICEFVEEAGIGLILFVYKLADE